MSQLQSELQAAVRARDFTGLRESFGRLLPSEIANLICRIHTDDQALLFRVLPRGLASKTFEYLPLGEQEELIKSMGHDEVAAILNSMADDDRTTLLEELPGAVTKQLLTLLSDEERASAVKLLGYPEQSVGRLMTPHYIAVRPAWTVQEVLDHVRAHGRDSETLNMVYVVDEEGMLVDDIRMRAFLLAPTTAHVSELMDNRYDALKATDDHQTAINLFRRTGLTALPVTDSDGMLVGIVTIDDVLEVAEAGATRDIQKIGGSEALDEPYMEISLMRMIRKRAGWLIILFLSEMLTATAMGFFEEEIAKAVVLALFVPLIISSGGNSGSQAATLVIRAMALGEVRLRDWWRVMRREVLSGLALGGTLGLIGFLRISVWSAFSDIYGPHWLLVALTIGISLVGIVLWGTLSGSMLPLALRRVGLDPATSSAPFVATLVDVTGLIIYFSVAMLILRGTLL
ncbi:MAG TPA: magnesium transporter [Pyrinomonadaceae bacterium]|jgi:magnesium transporter|nr:magnesium transporter [Pyrinomonadaceae bacterium]